MSGWQVNAWLALMWWAFLAAACLGAYLTRSPKPWALSIFLFLISAALNTLMAWSGYSYEWKDLGDGTIWSRKYGTYPKEVPWKPKDMVLMPGQQMRVAEVFDIPGEFKSVDGGHTWKLYALTDYSGDTKTRKLKEEGDGKERILG